MPDEDWKPGTGKPIMTVYAWVSTEPDGGEGVIAGTLPSLPGLTPLIGASRANMEHMRPCAERVKAITGYPIKLKRFTDGVVIDEL